MPGPVWLDVFERKFQQIHVLGRCRQLLEARIEVVAVVKEGSAGAVGEFGHYVLIERHGIAVTLEFIRVHESASSAWTLFASVQCCGVKPTGIERTDGDVRVRGEIENARFVGYGFGNNGEETRRNQNQRALTGEQGHAAKNIANKAEGYADILIANDQSAIGG